MRITLAELHEADIAPVTLLEILSIEGQGYLARLHIQGEPLILSDENGQSRLFRSAHEAQNELSDLDIGKTELVHPSAYDEMIGLDPDDREPLRIRLEGRKQ
ncbi:hypothetical protein SAMN05216203_2373 [Marinobacter daqiaonensis]|uniref:Cation transporter n=1 Tax=Marinobacter daqiaonensis TaxID=650891 RepID=A0A1I6IIZ1_9GAMM|nr:DUF6482 family protein [Marinobacter daqiaonensis]SFR66695.1 hypothetical protein SAMN05216203_2373 [Marinobacter daqiaonensis]